MTKIDTMHAYCYYCNNDNNPRITFYCIIGVWQTFDHGQCYFP
jgi:hypothetical protein